MFAILNYSVKPNFIFNQLFKVVYFANFFNHFESSLETEALNQFVANIKKFANYGQLTCGKEIDSQDCVDWERAIVPIFSMDYYLLFLERQKSCM